jgi:nucleotide-binding universal stress UspA family protein
VLAVPSKVSLFEHPLVAYSTSPKAKEALYIGAYMASKWGSTLTILTIDQESNQASDVQTLAQDYLSDLSIQANYICMPLTDYPHAILQTADEVQADAILMGGYKAPPLLEVVVGSILDQVLRETKIPVLVCR